MWISYILIIFYTGGGSGVAMAEFNGKPACEQAKETVMATSSVKTVTALCVRKYVQDVKKTQ